VNNSEDGRSNENGMQWLHSFSQHVTLNSTAEKQLFYQGGHDGDGDNAEYIAAHGKEGVLHQVGETKEFTAQIDEKHTCHNERNTQPNSFTWNFTKAFQIELDILEMDKMPNHGNARKYHGNTGGGNGCFTRGKVRNIATFVHDLNPCAWQGNDGREQNLVKEIVDD
jgi:hypothetical protein